MFDNRKKLEDLVIVPWSKISKGYKQLKTDIDQIEYPSIRTVCQGIVKEDLANLLDGGYVNAAIGVPGLEAPEEAIKAQQEALPKVHPHYPPFEGRLELKEETTRFLKLFFNLDQKELDPYQCVPTVGGMQACYFAILFSGLLGKNELNEKKRIVFIDPGFPVNKMQCDFNEVPFTSIDIGADYESRGWLDKLENECNKGDVIGVLYSNPNNPTGSVLDDNELLTISEICKKNNIIAIEDIAYALMDYTKDYTVPGKEPFIPTIAKFMEDKGKYMMLLSMSKLFSYAGEGIGVVKISDELYNTSIENIGLPTIQQTGVKRFGGLFPLGIYANTARAPSSAQVAATKMLKMANDGELKEYFAWVRSEYGYRIKHSLNLFEKNGFGLAYEIPRSEEGVGAALYISLEHSDYNHGGILLKDLLCFGIGVSPIYTCGGKKSAIRFSVSAVDKEKLILLEERLDKFREFREQAKELVARKEMELEQTYAINLPYRLSD